MFTDRGLAHRPTRVSMEAGSPLHYTRAMIVLAQTINDTAVPLGTVFGVIAIAAVVLHLLERVTTDAMMAGFGRSSVVIFTAWLGVPVHELSHAILCPVFGHRIVELRLFKLSTEDGTLGYVKHSYERRRLWPELGNFFIGMAPLAGGSLVLWGAMAGLFPEITPQFDGDIAGAGRQVVALVTSAFDWRLAVFAYVVLCVGGHMAPSSADLRCALPGFFVALALTVVVFSIAVATGHGPGLAETVNAGLAPLAAVLLLAIALNGAVHVLVAIVAVVVQRALGRTLAPLFIQNAWRYLAIVAGVVVLGGGMSMLA